MGAWESGRWTGPRPQPALGAVTHLGFQFCDLQVQFIQVLVHESDERLKEKHKPGIEMDTLARAAPWRPPPRPYREGKDQCHSTGRGPTKGASPGIAAEPGENERARPQSSLSSQERTPPQGLWDSKSQSQDCEGQRVPRGQSDRCSVLAPGWGA